VADRIYSDQPINAVVRQTPTSGLLMKVSQQAHVVLSWDNGNANLLEGNSLRGFANRAAADGAASGGSFRA